MSLPTTLEKSLKGLDTEIEALRRNQRVANRMLDQLTRKTDFCAQRQIYSANHQIPGEKCA